MELIINWVTGIVFAALFATFLELLLPASNMQKFVRVIMGLLIMLAILNPVIAYVENKPTAAAVAAFTPLEPDMKILDERTTAAINKREHLIQIIYQRDLAKQMQSLVLGIAGISHAEVEVRCSNIKERLSKIETVHVLIRLKQHNYIVDKVVIGSSPIKAKVPAEIANTIKRRLSELYYIKHDQILVELID